MNQIFTPFERLVLRALWMLLIGPRFFNQHDLTSITEEIDLAIRTSDGQQRADEAQKRILP